MSTDQEVLVQHQKVLHEAGELATLAHKANADSRCMSEQLSFLNSPANWQRFWKNAPSDLPQHTMEAADDIMRDMMLEAGFFYDDDTDIVVSPLTNAAIIGFRHGAAYASNPENDRFKQAVSQPEVTGFETNEYNFAVVRGRHIKLAEGVPLYVFVLMLDQAVDAMIDLLETPPSDRTDYQRGNCDGRLFALENVLHAEEMMPSQIVGMVIASKVLNPR